MCIICACPRSRFAEPGARGQSLHFKFVNESPDNHVERVRDPKLKTDTYHRLSHQFNLASSTTGDTAQMPHCALLIFSMYLIKQTKAHVSTLFLFLLLLLGCRLCFLLLSGASLGGCRRRRCHGRRGGSGTSTDVAQ